MKEITEQAILIPSVMVMSDGTEWIVNDYKITGGLCETTHIEIKAFRFIPDKSKPETDESKP